MAPTADPATVMGLPESALHPDHLSALPTRVPPAPWECRARALIWVQRSTRPRFGWLGRPTPLTLICFVEYLEGPVGTYQEVLAGSLVRTGRLPKLQVPFIAVDSLTSVAGGRVNWALPKTMAGFDTDLEAGFARAEGNDWSVSVRPAKAASPGTAGRLVPRLPIRARFSSIGPLGVYGTSLRATGRWLRIHTEAEGETLTGWLGHGTHTAAILTGRLRITAPRPLSR